MDYGPVNMQLNMRPNIGASGGWASTSNTYFVQSDLPVGPELIGEFTSAAEQLFTSIATIMGGRDIYCTCNYNPRGPSTFPEGFDEIALLDGGYVEAAPWWESILIKKFTGSPPRYTVGRAYVPFIGKELSNGPIIEYTNPEVVAVANKFAETLTSGTMVLTPIIWHPSTASGDLVVKCEPSQFLAFQRRRNASSRYYEYP